MASEVERVAAGLTKAQREAIKRHDERVHSRVGVHYRTLASLFAAGISADVRAAGFRFFSLTAFGLAVRAHLLAQERAHHD